MSQKKIIERCAEELKCTKKESNILWQEFEKFLQLKRFLQDYNGDLVIPSPLIDKVWRISILDTQQYSLLCGKNFLHYQFLNPAKNDEIWQKYVRTVSQLQELFNYEVDINIWPTQRPLLSATSRPLSDNSESFNHKCNQCEQQFATKGLLVAHIQLRHQLSFQFTFPDGFNGVYLKLPGTEPICPRCKKSFKSGKILQQHARNSCKGSMK